VRFNKALCLRGMDAGIDRGANRTHYYAAPHNNAGIRAGTPLGGSGRTDNTEVIPMSMHEDFTQPLRRIADITPAEIEAYLREARRQRALAFSHFFLALGRSLRRPLRRGRSARSLGGRGAAMPESL
jgi:hypothetical protein